MSKPARTYLEAGWRALRKLAALDRLRNSSAATEHLTIIALALTEAGAAVHHAREELLRGSGLDGGELLRIFDMVLPREGIPRKKGGPDGPFLANGQPG